METVDENPIRFMEESKKEGKPFFIWWNATRMHIWTRLKPSSQGKTGLGIYPDGMVEHDGMVGQLLDKLKELGLEDNTIVMYSTDNGAKRCRGRTAARRRSGVRRTPTGRADTACPA